MMRFKELYIENKFKKLYENSFNIDGIILNEDWNFSWETISEENKDLYVVKHQKAIINGEKLDKVSDMCYSPNGKYIGNEDFVKFLINKKGITEFDTADPNDSVISIGFNSKEGKWAGWSHRGMCSFGIGDKIFDEKYGNDKTLFTQHGKETIKTLEQAKQAAKNFANYVS